MSEPTPDELRQQLLDAPLAGDDDVIGLTRRQAIKIAAVLDAYTRGNQQLYYDAVLDIRNLLLAHAYDGQGATGIPTPADAGSRLNHWPWPT
ncbi:hypothetical protein [uncultured Pseudokineococcus sp.]|uniref:hypothetical protein n=1 Tax=uncultured Pseudokineococcus sp. TaxID=1642928 RepID=UPI002606F2CB|nr:hypothetical protein [uncultured Pseudokineococcus sp.]